MSTYAQQNLRDLQAAKAQLTQDYAEFKSRGLALNMARGKPAQAQLNLSMPLLENDICASCYLSAEGIDCRNYGVLDGLSEAKRLMAILLDDEPENVIVTGNSSLSAMYDTLARFWMFGTKGAKPWHTLKNIKWLCPCPGYDRHFAITEAFGWEMIPVPMTGEGPDMDMVESIVLSDASVKGIWCVPQYSNPGGVTYSDAVVQRLATMPCAAEDFRIIWDNAYSVHHLFDEVSKQDKVADIAKACRAANTENRFIKFASTSKITFPGAGISAVAASPENIAEIKKHLGVQTIGYDKLNQLRHVHFLRDEAGLTAHMSKHAAILRPKFELVEQKLCEGLGEVDFCSWSHPRGGYFVSFNAPANTATRIVSLAKAAGVIMTDAGATYPYRHDPHDSNIRIAPTMPALEELSEAMDVFVCCVKLAYLEKLLA